MNNASLTKSMSLVYYYTPVSNGLSLNKNKSDTGGGDAKSRKLGALPNYGFNFKCDERAEKRKEVNFIAALA